MPHQVKKHSNETQALHLSSEFFPRMSKPARGHHEDVVLQLPSWVNTLQCFPQGTEASSPWKLGMPGQGRNLLFLVCMLFKIRFYVSFFCPGSGDRELCLGTRSSAWQTLHCTKISDASKAFGASPQGQLKTPCILTDWVLSAWAGSSPGGAATVILSCLPHSLW